MVTMNGYTVTPHHRQNRRRERPGSRTRRTITRKANVQYDVYEGVLDACDAEVHLPSDKARPSPLLRQNFDQNWQKWKARQAEEKALAEMDRMQLEQEQLQFEIGDDELYRLGILYNDNEDLAQDSDSNTIACDVPIEPSVPMFIFRQGKPRLSRRRSNWSSLPLYLSLSSLSDDADISRLLSLSPFPTIQHRLTQAPTTTSTDIPQSLPTSALEFPYHDVNNDNTHSISSAQQHQHQHILDFNSGDWTFIHTPHHADPSPTPSSEPETWILIDDS
ncbi:hypothetical protein ONS95_009438 [Cadophora gregata]|uniref:uncharacterized protein n=1 Tax=Cadophora gregata TaxID=51156 RepID=UPI0026DAD79B|nr:uncharacterized protein ONS95_009438 [Cadophora gregata]KAK0124486.1 hypothetical protein ONS95_009438 [Cadophora gregata]